MRNFILACVAMLLLAYPINFFTKTTSTKNTTTTNGEFSQIVLSDDNFTDENIYKYHDVKLINKMPILANNQDMFADSENLPDIALLDLANWKPNFANTVVGARGIIDLKKTYKILNIVALDSFGNQSVVVESGKPFNWKPEFTMELNAFKSYAKYAVNIETRYLHLSCSSNDTSLAELVLYGYEVNSNNDESFSQQPKNKPVTTIDKALGVNAFVDDPLHVSKVGGHIREFHNISFTYNTKNYFSPSANNAWDFDEYYKSLHDKGIDPVPCIQGTHTSISGDNIPSYSGNEKPINPGADSLIPSSYADHASVMFNYAARYGKEKIDKSRLNLASNQKPLTGLSYITYYENFNEPNKDWEGEKSYLSPYEMAAMCSADYDGHEGRLGKNFGIKAADKSAKLVMGGLVGRNVIEYVNLMKLWFENNRTDKLFAIDVINLHYYIKTAAVEKTTMKTDLKKIVDYVKKELPGVEVWVTEYGPEIDESEISDRFSEEYYEAKGFSTVRMFLDGMAAGVDRMTMFMLRDTNSGIYSTDGLVTYKGEWKTKPSWHYLFGTKVALTNTVFDSEQSTNNEMIYKFKGSNKDVYAMWLPTTGKEERYIEFEVGNKRSAQLTVLADFYAEGLTENLQITNGKVRVKLSARPVFLSLYNNENVKIAPTKKLIEIKNITGPTNTLAKIKVMFDEQDIAPITPSARARGEFKNYANNSDYVGSNPNVPENRVYPIEGIIDLGEDKTITDIGYYDANNNGDIFVYALDRHGNWQQINYYGLNKYNEWTVVECNKIVKTRYLKVMKYTESPCYEMVLFGY